MINIALCDDEPAFLESLHHRIADYLRARDTKFSTTLFLSGDMLLASKTHFDIIFLDIKMSGTDGMKTAERLRRRGDECALIFVSSIIDYAPDAFEVAAVSYLLKPVEDEKLFSVLRKITGSIERGEARFLLLKAGGQMKKLPLSDITYVEALDHSVFVHTKSASESCNKKIELLFSELCEQSENFFRCHRGYIINLQQVRSYADGIATLESGEKLPVAKRRRTQFLHELLLCQRREVR